MKRVRFSSPLCQILNDNPTKKNAKISRGQDNPPCRRQYQVPRQDGDEQSGWGSRKISWNVKWLATSRKGETGSLEEQKVPGTKGYQLISVDLIGIPENLYMLTRFMLETWYRQRRQPLLKVDLHYIDHQITLHGDEVTFHDYAAPKMIKRQQQKSFRHSSGVGIIEKGCRAEKRERRIPQMNSWSKKIIERANYSSPYDQKSLNPDAKSFVSMCRIRPMTNVLPWKP